jgi:hypothetical protein
MRPSTLRPAAPSRRHRARRSQEGPGHRFGPVATNVRSTSASRPTRSAVCRPSPCRSSSCGTRMPVMGAQLVPDLWGPDQQSDPLLHARQTLGGPVDVREEHAVATICRTASEDGVNGRIPKGVGSGARSRTVRAANPPEELAPCVADASEHGASARLRLSGQRSVERSSTGWSRRGACTLKRSWMHVRR